MKLSKILTASAASIALTAMLGSTSFAQDTTSAIRGVVTDDTGSPLANSTVIVTNTLTGRTSTITTNANGQFALRNLNVGGNYTVTVTRDGYAGERIENLSLTLGQTSDLTFDLSAVATTSDEIVIVGTRSVAADLATGPNASFSLETLEAAPAINRDIKDIVRLDPRIYVDESFNDAIQCAGANPRFNSLTVDGLRLNDNFGLNSNGYPTERIPFSFDAIGQVAVELAPFDVEYGGFTACNINAVTKSGTNKFTGGFFVDFNSDTYKGDKAANIDIDNGDFTEYRYGIHGGMPIIEDKLFIFAAYEKLEGANLFGANNVANANILQSEYDQIISIAETQYGYVSGGLPASADNEDEKLMLKLDWNVNDAHRAALTYIYNDGFNISPSDSGSTRLADGNHFYERGAQLKSYSASVYSDWSGDLSTEFRLSYTDLDNRQIPVAGTEFGEIQVRVPRQSGGTTTVYLGADDSRHANKLAYELFTVKAKADYQWNEHLFTFGVEREEFDVFNLFIQEVEGEWRFDSIADFASGDFGDFRYENAAGTNNPIDAAAQFGFEQTALYIQDEWDVSANLLVTAGLRYDYYSSDDNPAFNQDFFDDYGFGNDANLDGKGLLQPRVGFQYEASDQLELRGGVGLFSGGNPNVWLSNNYSNNGVTLFECRNRGRSSDCVGGGALTNINDFTYGGGTGRPFFDVPDEFIQEVATASGRGPVNALDPDFEISSEWKYSLGATYEFVNDNFTNGHILNLDALYSQTNEAAFVRNLELTQVDTAPDGRPIYSGAPFNDFLLTNADEKGHALSLSAYLEKDFDNGFDYSVGYAYTDAQDVNPMTSSVAFSNDKNYTTSDPINPSVATSNYEIPHRFTLKLKYETELFGDLRTRAYLFGSANQGRPFSYTYSRNSEFEGFFANSRQLAYIPLGPNDTNVVYNGPAAEAAAFYDFVARSEFDDVRGGIAERNKFHDDWWTKFDLKFEQQFPGLRAEDKASGYILFENVGNLLNSDWGVQRQQGFPGNTQLVDVDIVGGAYEYSNFNASAGQGGVQTGSSTWEVRFGVEYDF